MKKDIFEMKAKYIKWCIDNKKQAGEETFKEFLQNYEKEYVEYVENAKVSLAELVQDNEELGRKVNGVFGFLIEKEDYAGNATLQHFGVGHAHKSHLAKALLVMLDQLLLDGEMTDKIENVTIDMIQPIQMMVVAMIKTLFGDSKKEIKDDEELNSKHIC